MTAGRSPRALAVTFGALLVAGCGAGAPLGHQPAVAVTESSTTATPAALAARPPVVVGRQATCLMASVETMNAALAPASQVVAACDGPSG